MIIGIALSLFVHSSHSRRLNREIKFVCNKKSIEIYIYTFFNSSDVFYAWAFSLSHFAFPLIYVPNMVLRLSLISIFLGTITNENLAWPPPPPFARRALWNACRSLYEYIGKTYLFVTNPKYSKYLIKFGVNMFSCMKWNIVCIVRFSSFYPQFP